MYKSYSFKDQVMWYPLSATTSNHLYQLSKQAAKSIQAGLVHWKWRSKKL